MAAIENTTGTASYYDKVDGLARWLGESVAAAFFASLEWCACVNVQTEGEDDEEAYDRPLMLTNLGSVRISNFDSNSVSDYGNLSNNLNSVDNIPI